MAAKTVLLGSKTKTADGGISQKVTTSYKKWYDRLILAVRLAMPATTPYTVVHTENLVGLFSCIFIKSAERNSLKHVSITTIKRGMGGRYGNKVKKTYYCPSSCERVLGTGTDVTHPFLHRAASFPVSWLTIRRCVSSTAILRQDNRMSVSAMLISRLFLRRSRCSLRQI